MKSNSEPNAPKQSEASSREGGEAGKEAANRERTKDANKLVYKGNVQGKLDAERAKQSKRDEIPLIDDGVEETGEPERRGEPEAESASSQSRSNGEDREDGAVHSPTGPASQIDRPQSNTTVSSDTPSIPADQPVAGLDQPHGQMMNNFQNINLNDDGVNEPHSSDLCQCKCFWFIAVRNRLIDLWTLVIEWNSLNVAY